MKRIGIAPLVVLLAAGAALAQPPAERPEKSGLVRHAEGAFEGYTLFAPLRSTHTYLIDMKGQVVHEWESDAPPGNSVYLLENGHLLRTASVRDNPTFRGGGMGGRIQEIDWDGTVLWDYVYSTESHLHHHDVERLPSGNVLLVAWERKSAEEAIEAGRDPSLVREGGELWPDHVVEVKPTGRTTGEIVWAWHAWDHLVQDRDPKKKNYGAVSEHPELIDINGDQGRGRMSEEERRRLEALGYVRGGGAERRRGEHRGPGGHDWTHINSIDYHPELDQIALSVHTFNEIWVIDHGTTTAEAAGHTGGRHGRGGDLLYRWGNPEAWGRGSAEDRRLFRQHDARWIDAGLPGAGHFLLFNNGSHGEGRAWSSVDEIAPPVDAEGRYRLVEGEAYGPEGPTWTYAAEERTEFYSSHISGADRLPNGNTLVCEGETGRLFEVTREGRIVWEYVSPHEGNVGPPPPMMGGLRLPGDLPDGRRRPAGPPPRFGERRGGRRGLGPGPGGGGGGIFRAERYAPDYPGLARLREAKPAVEAGRGVRPAPQR
jgi:hypothetical protein